MKTRLYTVVRIDALTLHEEPMLYCYIDKDKARAYAKQLNDTLSSDSEDIYFYTLKCLLLVTEETI